MPACTRHRREKRMECRRWNNSRHILDIMLGSPFHRRRMLSLPNLIDTSDLGCSIHWTSCFQRLDPTVTIVTSLFNTLRDQIRGVTKSIIGLSGDENVKCVLSDLDPCTYSGLAHGSLVVGISIHPPDDGSSNYGQVKVPGVSLEVVESIRGAVRSIATVARHVHEDRIDENAIQSDFPDPAIRRYRNGCRK